MLREPSSGYSSNCDKDILGVQKALLKMFWEYSPSSANIASDRLRAKRVSSPVDEEEEKKKERKKKKKKKREREKKRKKKKRKKEEKKKKRGMTVSILHSLRRELTYFCLVSGTQNDIVVS